jgi:hypothetical protein
MFRFSNLLLMFLFLAVAACGGVSLPGLASFEADVLRGLPHQPTGPGVCLGVGVRLQPISLRWIFVSCHVRD